MVYEVSDNRLTIADYFFEMDTENNLHIYAKGMRYLDKVEIGHSLDFEGFKERCNQWLSSK